MSASSSPFGRARRRLYQMLDPRPEDGLVDQIFNWLVVGLILLNVLAATLETVPALAGRYAGAFAALETGSLLFFTAEYALRLWTAVEHPAHAHPLWGRLRAMVTPAALIDAAVILPFYAARLFAIDLGVLRVLRLLRVFMLLKLVRYSRAVRMLGTVLVRQAEPLTVTLTIGLMLLVLASTLMYMVEHAVQPQAFPHIPAAMWWGVATLTTVGYGDVYPVTLLGRLLGGTIAVLGVGLFALPAGILASGISDEMQAQRRELDALREAPEGCCPHCRAPLDAPERRRAS